MNHPAETGWKAQVLHQRTGLWVYLAGDGDITDATVAARTVADETGQPTRVTKYELGAPIIQFTPQPSED